MTKVKICGVSRPEDALVAAEAGADFVGMIFAESRRQVTIEQARAVVDALRALGESRPRAVGVFVNAEPAAVNAIVRDVGLDLVQLSGDEDEDYWQEVRGPAIKVIHLGPTGPGPAASNALRRRLVAVAGMDLLPLLDAKAEGQYGGSGRSFDWEAAKGLDGDFEFLMAGGLTPGNVADAIAAVHPWGVDVSSGVETAGAKDPDKIRAFVRAAKDHN